MAARSNLQQAVPVSFGFKMARLLASFLRHRERIDELAKRVLIVEFGGAAGTLATISESTSYAVKPGAPDDEPLGLRCQALLAQELGLSVPLIAWHTERDNFAEVAGFFALLTATCAKFATDLKLMMQTEVGEVSEPFVHSRGSSSTMPQKRNPIGSAYICAMASSVRSMASSMVEAVVADHERSTGPWEIEWIMLPQICCLTHSTLTHTEYLIEGLEVSEDAMEKNLAITKGNIVSEAVMMGLGRALGRSFAHDLIYDLCRKAVQDDIRLVDLLLADEQIGKSKVTEDEIRRLCDPANYLGLSRTMVEKVLTQVTSL
ncbi:L-Aspartase-like protein [Myriangium duriaei CBS 260.36]|uniref:L-Aspartase-like protein n=1 Tax=Myriangium duriaei CBS 260.36 TaxID=1168546 RepID=A0A9P4IXB0_9PEZI|nr:L-Aspartase-like protein [Myriangium duriaei CBS 260.36]